MVKKSSIYKLEVWTDGSCLKNPGPGGWAYLVKGTVNGSSSGRAAETTNNQMELTAILRLLQRLTKVEASAGSQVTIYTDSNYAMKSVTTWHVNWVKNNWQTSAKKPVLNKELIEEILALMKTLAPIWKIDFIWVKGHADCLENQQVDAMANQKATSLVT